MEFWCAFFSACEHRLELVDERIYLGFSLTLKLLLLAFFVIFDRKFCSKFVHYFIMKNYLVFEISKYF